MRPVSLAKLSLSSLLLSGAVSLLAGCPAPDYPGCKKDAHCREDLGETCVDGTCQNCASDVDCVGKNRGGVGDGVCFENRCVDPNDPALSGGLADGSGPNFDAPCTTNTECTGGAVCVSGVCSRCTDDLLCNGGTCDLTAGVCTQPVAGACTNDDECAMDEICDLGSCVFSTIVPGGENPCGIDAIFFDFDSPKISGDAQAKLDELAPCLSEQGKLVYLEAHADPRGTEEYNIMLTDRRGQSVKNYLNTKGVEAGNMQVISKGNLESTGSSEAEWAKDRRVEFIFP